MKMNNQNGGDGYYQAVSEPPIGGRPARATYPSCCPPVFCSSLTGGSSKTSKPTKKISINHRIGHSIYEVEKFLDHLKSNELSSLLNKLVGNKLDHHTHQYNHNFNKKMMRTMASTMLLDRYINKNPIVHNMNEVASINKILKKQNESVSGLLTYLYDVKVRNKNIKTLHTGGMYAPEFYSLGHYIGPIGVGVFTAGALIFLLKRLYNKPSNNIVGGVRINLSKKDVVSTIKKLIDPIHYYKFTKKTFEDIGRFSNKSIKSIKMNRKLATKRFRKK